MKDDTFDSVLYRPLCTLHFSSHRTQLIDKILDEPCENAGENREEEIVYYSLSCEQVKRMLDRFVISYERKQILLDLIRHKHCVRVRRDHEERTWDLNLLLSAFDWEMDKSYVQNEMFPYLE